MDRFDPDTIRLLTLIALGATILGYIVVALRHRRQAGVRIDSFLRYRREDGSGPAVSSQLLRATLMASAFSLASAIYVYIDWAGADGMFVLWSPITWAAGALLLYLLRAAIFRESRGAWTLHQFLGQRYSSRGLMRLASIVTSTVFLLQVAAEVYVGLAVLSVSLGAGWPLWLLCLLVGGVFIAYSLIGGLPSVLITDKFQYRWTAFALLIVTIILFNNGGQTAVENIVESLGSTFIPSGSQWVVLLGLLALNLPLFVTDMSVWQRVGATSSEAEVTKGLGSFVLALLGWMSLLVALGVGFAMFFEPAEGLTSSQMLLNYFSDSTVFPLLLVGFFAALLSTGDTFLIASVQTVLVDWKYADSLKEAEFNAESLPARTHAEMFRDARLGILLLGIGSVLLGYIFFQSLPSLLDLLFVVFGLQAALAPAVVWGLLGRGASTQARAAKASLVVGGLAGLICLVLALRGVELLGVTLGLWAPVLVLSVASTVFFGVRGE